MNIQRDPVYVEITKKVLPRYRRLSNNRFDNVTVNGVALDATSIVLKEDLLGLDLLSDPDADRILYWNNSNDTLEWLAPGDHVEISGGQINHLAPGTPSTLSVTSAHYITGINKDIYGHVTGFTESPLPISTLGTDGQIPYMNAGGTDFIYTNSPTVDSNGYFITNNLIKVGNVWDLTNAAPTDGYVLTANGTTESEWRKAVVSVSITGGNVTGTGSYDAITGTLTISNLTAPTTSGSVGTLAQVLNQGRVGNKGTITGTFDTPTDAVFSIPETSYIYTTIGGGYLRRLIGMNNSTEVISIGQTGTALIDSIQLLAGNGGIVELYSAGLQTLVATANGGVQLPQNNANAPNGAGRFSAYVLQSTYWYNHTSDSYMYLAESGNTIQVRGIISFGNNGSSANDFKVTGNIGDQGRVISVSTDNAFTSSGGIQVYLNDYANYRGQYFWDTAAIGILNDQGNWSYRGYNGGAQIYAASNAVIAQFSSTEIYMPNNAKLRWTDGSDNGYLEFRSNWGSSGTAQFLGTTNRFMIDTVSSLVFRVANGSGTVAFNVDTVNIRVGVASASPSYTLDVGGDVRSTTGYFRRDSSDYIQINTDDIGLYVNGTEQTRVDSSGIIYARQNIIGYSSALSDPKLKYNADSFDAVTILKQTKGYKFQWKDTHKWDFGFMANEAHPWLVNEVVGGLEKSGYTDYLTVHYQGYVPILTEGWNNHEIRLTDLETKEQQQDREIESLRSENEELKRRLDELS